MRVHLLSKRGFRALPLSSADKITMRHLTIEAVKV
jgi:hypothetical protein